MFRNGRVKIRSGLLATACFATFSACPIVAQASEGVGGGVETVVVSGIRGSLSEALNVKRVSTEFLDALVAEDFAQFPDTNLAEALQRIPGITVDRSESADQSNAIGEGKTINLRGLDATFTRTEINGMTATSPGSERSFSFNVLASELFAKATVHKSLTAKDNEGGLAGTVDLRTYRPFDFDGQLVSLSARGTYTENAGAATPAGTAIFADKTASGRFGVAVGINFDKTHPRDFSVDSTNWDYLSDQFGTNYASLSAQDKARIQSVQSPLGPRIIENDRKQNRMNATVSLQARPVDSLTLTFDNIIALVDHTGVQNRQGLSVQSKFSKVPTDLTLDGDRLVSATFTTGKPVASLINYEYDNQVTIYQGILSAEWKVADAFTVSPSLGYSYANDDWRKWDQITLISDVADTVIGSQGDYTYFKTAAGSTIDPGIYKHLSSVRNRPHVDLDKELAARLDFSWKPTFGFVDSFEFGGRWAKRTKKHDAYDGAAVINTAVTDFTPYITAENFGFDGAPSVIPSKILSFDFAGIRKATGTDNVSVALLKESSYAVTEDVYAGYVVANYSYGSFSGNAGVRLVSTHQVSSGYQTVKSSSGASQLAPAEFANDYTYALPSLNLRWNVSDDLVARGSVYRSLSRPQLADIQPSRTIPNFNGGNGTAGNPDLKPFTALNADLGFEWYFGKDAMLSAAYFRKDLNGLIETVTQEVTVVDPVTNNTLDVFLSRPTNGKGASVNGIEVGIQSPFSFLPKPFNDAGVVLNGTFTDSAATFSDASDVRKSTLPGLSKMSFNAILYYDADPFSARLAYNWRDSYLLQASGTGGQPVSRFAYGQLDWALTYKLSRGLNITFHALNLTDEKIRSYTDFDENKVKGLLQNGRKFVVGVNYKM